MALPPSRIIMLPFRHPFTSVVLGSTGSDKMEFVMRLVGNVDAIIEPTPHKIIYYITKYELFFEC